MNSRCSHRMLLLLMLLCTCAPSAWAQSVRVHLKVSADEQLKMALQKHLESELGMQPGIVLGADSSDFTISVVALKVVTRSSKSVGVAISVLVSAPHEAKIREFAEAHIPHELRAKLMSITDGTVKPLAHWVETASAGELEQVARSIVNSFVKDVLASRQKAAVPRHIETDAISLSRRILWRARISALSPVPSTD